MRYIGRKHNLLGATDKEAMRVDLMENQLGEFRDTWVSLCYNPNFVISSFLKALKISFFVTDLNVKNIF